MNYLCCIGRYRINLAEIFYIFGCCSCFLKKFTFSGFKMILTCTEGVSTVRQGDPTSLYALKRFNRNGAMSTAFILQEVTQARSIPFK